MNLHTLYETRRYPAMSHPNADPAVMAAAARLAGLDVAEPGRARILEIGCCSGHHLIPLAARWPEADFTGIDLADANIAAARELAAIAGVGNLRFLTADLCDFAPRQQYDFIIAHGFLSWVPDEVKNALFPFLRDHLSPNGIAVVSFNLACGWKPRFPLVEKARAIMEAGGTDEMTALAVLHDLASAEEKTIIADMLAKGPDILPFDDFGPINDPWSLPDFLTVSGCAGLRWLGESDASANLPPGMDAEEWRRIVSSAPDPLAGQVAADEAAGRTFRSALLSRDDAPVKGGIRTADLMDFHFRTKDDSRLETDARQIIALVHQGRVEARIGHVEFDESVPDHPRLDSFRLACASRRLPIVDAWHKPCAFPAAHSALLALMDGRRSLRELRTIVATDCPELAFDPWLKHLAARGFFA